MKLNKLPILISAAVSFCVCFAVGVGVAKLSGEPRKVLEVTTAAQWKTCEDLVRDAGKWPLTRSEAEEIVRALLDSASAHHLALNFYEASLKAFGETATKEERDRMTQNLQQCKEGSERTLALLEKWKARGAKLRD